jgi:hypothetical protein
MTKIVQNTLAQNRAATLVSEVTGGILAILLVAILV